MRTGTIKAVVETRGFGFIAAPGSDDIFFHVKALDPRLPFDDQLTGRRVTFEATATVKGLQAVDVRPAD